MGETIFEQLIKNKEVGGKWWERENKWPTVATSLPPDLKSLFDFVVEIAGSRKATVARYFIHNRLLDIFGHQEGGEGPRTLTVTAQQLKERVAAMSPTQYLEFRKMLKSYIYPADILAYLKKIKETNDTI